jgi:uncharacterized protein YuzE
MDQIKVFYDQADNTLTVWVGEPEDEHIDEETADEVILIKDCAGRVIGFEKLNFTVSEPEQLRVTFEAVSG